MESEQVGIFESFRSKELSRSEIRCRELLVIQQIKSVNMSSEIQNLEPKEVWQVFNEMLQIPRPSNHEKKIQDWAVDFGKKLGL
ncbi:MAG TPA: hypothetical protein VKA10_07480, partial [Prolixibacteraceae bacterium]|nr:hypothetical protein [Prolixibacteraceae bacterium]